MPRAYGYASATQGEDPAAITAQEEAISKVYQERFAATHEWFGVYADETTGNSVKLGCRTQGVHLCAQLEPGDVLITNHRYGFARINDLADAATRWLEQKVRLVLLDLAIDSGTDAGLAALRTLIATRELDRQQLRDLTRIRRKRAGISSYGRAPYGFAHIGPAGKRRQVPDPNERAIGMKIVEWTDAGWNWVQIYLHLKQLKIHTRDGREWSREAIKRAYYAERKLQGLDEEEESC